MRTEAIDWLGVLATDEEIRNNGLGHSNGIINKWDSLQFYIKVISKMPGETLNSQYVVCYGNKIDSDMITDNGAFDETVRIEDYVKQLRNCFFRFNYEENPAGYYIARNIEITELSESYSNGKVFFYVPVIIKNQPAFSEDKQYDTYEQVEQAIKNGEFVCKLNKYNTTDMDNIPYIVFYNPELLEYHIIGNFTKFEYDITRGIKFEYNELKSFSFEEDWYDDVVTFEDAHSGIFLGEYVHKKIMDQLDEEKPIDIKKDERNEEEELKNISKLQMDKENEEWEFIEHFDAVAKKDGLFYTKKDLINFHTAVKSSSLVILSGLSGTGKSQLVQCYAKALGLQEDAFFHMIPVRPNWNDDSDLVGFVDSMHMVYRPSDTGFINILIEASQERNKDKLYIICFDEMNLARVEHYFSQFLSILEMPDKSRILRLYASEYERRLYNSDKYKSTVEIGNNIRFIGTVNIDESTFHFSDKVLDRANVIKLNVVPYTEWKETEATIKGATIKEWSYDEYKKLIRKDLILSEREREFIWRVHKTLNSCAKNLGVGPRILRQIGKYLANLPVAENVENITREEGFDLQFVQRIMTKIRGQKEQLEVIFNEESEESLSRLFDEYADVSKFENSRRNLEIKRQEIGIYGYTL